MTSNVTPPLPNHSPEKKPETVEKDVRKWVESICEYKANLDMEKCELPPKKATKKVRKVKTKKKISVHSVHTEENIPGKTEQKPKPKPVKKKMPSKDKTGKDTHTTPSMTVFDNLKDHYKNVKLPPNWVSGQSRGRLVFCRVKIMSQGSRFEMVSDRGVAITNDCMVHVFIDGPEIALSNWKLQKVESIDDIRKAIKAVDGFKVCTGSLPSGVKSPSCSIFLTGDTKTCQSCLSDISHLKVSGMKVKPNAKTTNKPSGSIQK